MNPTQLVCSENTHCNSFWVKDVKILCCTVYEDSIYSVLVCAVCYYTRCNTDVNTYLSVCRYCRYNCENSSQVKAGVDVVSTHGQVPTAKGFFISLTYSFHCLAKEIQLAEITMLYVCNVHQLNVKRHVHLHTWTAFSVCVGSFWQIAPQGHCIMWNHSDWPWLHGLPFDSWDEEREPGRRHGLWLKETAPPHGPYPSLLGGSAAHTSP